MKLVVDANVIFAAFIKHSETRKIILKEKLELFVPEFVFEEIKKYAPYLQRKSKADETEFSHVQELIFAQINVVQKKEFSKFLSQTRKTSSDKKDWPFLALALSIHLPIWSNDKGFKEQSEIKVFNTKELINELTE